MDFGSFVYVDWEDNSLPEHTSGETAEAIKSKIRSNKKFILLATEDAIASKWCNWELGYGDANKFDENIAIFPIAENDGKWTGAEYLQIYPSITTESDGENINYFVEYKNNRQRLQDWLRA